jgi:hypothetical protein
MLELFSKVSATRTRPTFTNTGGRMVADSVESVSVLIIEPQPAGGRDLQIVPEGERNYDHRKTWVDSETRNGDLIAYDGASFKVVQTQKWIDPETRETWWRIMMREVVHVG